MKLLYHLYLKYRERSAWRRLNRIVRATRESYATQEYIKRRKAAKLGIARKRGMA